MSKKKYNHVFKIPLTKLKFINIFFGTMDNNNSLKQIVNNNQHNPLTIRNRQQQK